MVNFFKAILLDMEPIYSTVTILTVSSNTDLFKQHQYQIQRTQLVTSTRIY